MSFPMEIYRRAREIKNEQRREAQNLAQERYNSFVKHCPEYDTLRSQLNKTSGELAALILGAPGDIEEIRDRNLATQEKMDKLLSAAGYSADYLETRYFCEKCCDEGLIDGKVCSCLTDIMKKLSFDELNARTPLSVSSFESFDLSHYPDVAENARGISPKKIMEHNLDRCKRYAENFSLHSSSLLFQGGVGLGKTHLSLAIAGKVIEKGYNVLYGSASSFFEQLEKEHFNRNSTTDTRYLLESCDLLIIDDLGAEFTTSFTVSVLLELINSRLLQNRPTIISTNMHYEGLEQRYSERFVSRLAGSYQRLQFAGKDLRIKLRKARVAEND